MVDNRITEGVIWKELIKYCIPIACGTLFQQLYNVVDAIIVGRFVGKEALAAVGGSASIITMIVVGFFSGLAAGASVVIAQHYGAKDANKVSEAVHTAVAFAIIAGIVIGVAGWLGTEWLLSTMKTPAETMSDSIAYLKVYFVGLIATLTFNMGASIMRSIGDSKRPLYFLTICSAVNIMLDFIFVVYFEWGVKGAAIATVLAQAVSAVITLYSLSHSYEDVKLEFKKIKIEPKVLKRELQIGIPGGFQFCISGITNMMIQTSINTFGTDVTTAWAAYNKIDLFYWDILSAFGAATMTFVGQNYGAKKFDRVGKSTKAALLISMALGGIICLFMINFAGDLIGIFVKDEAVIRAGVSMVLFMSPLYIISSLMEIPSGAMRGLGYAFWPMVFTSSLMIGLRIPWLLFVVPKHHTVNCVLVTYPMVIIAAAVLVGIYYFVKMKKLREIYSTDRRGIE